MIIFALDCHSKASAIAIMEDDVLLYECMYNSQLTHSETLLKLCDDAFKATNLKPQDVDLFGVANGPGSFTGLRIGLSIIKAMAYVHNKPCVGICSLNSLAYSLFFDGYIAAAIDARRDDIYCALYYKKDNKLTQIVEACALSCLEFEEIVLNLKLNENNIISIGDGALKLSQQTKLFNACTNIYNMGRASSICALALNEYKKNNTVSHSELAPFYLKLSQAEHELLLKNKEN